MEEIIVSSVSKMKKYRIASYKGNYIIQRYEKYFGPLERFITKLFGGETAGWLSFTGHINDKTGPQFEYSESLAETYSNTEAAETDLKAVMNFKPAEAVSVKEYE